MVAFLTSFGNRSPCRDSGTKRLVPFYTCASMLGPTPNAGFTSNRSYSRSWRTCSKSRSAP